MKQAKLMNVELCKLKPFEYHPYKVQDDAEMDALTESIKENGIMTPLLVRSLNDGSGEYEVISGHRRMRAAEKAGLKIVPAFVAEIDRSAYRIRGTLGEPLSQPPYGYMKSPENKKKWIIDPEAAAVVKRIFRMALEGKGNETIARVLQEDKILAPMAYWYSKGLNRGGKRTQPNPYKWGSTMVGGILAQQEYCGDVINFKTYSKSFKNKTRFDNPTENWAIFKDVHEPIIDRDTFERVQTLVAKSKRRAPKPKNSERSSGWN